MSLATRCPHCNTIFKVVQDQLKVSEGWVRCGRCTQVFNALEGLFDMEREAPPQRIVPPTAPVATPAPPAMPEAWAATPAFQPTEPSPHAPDDAIVTDDLPPPDPRPTPAVTSFELDLPPSDEAVAAAMSALTQPAIQTARDEEADADYPVTDEADALDSRYLLPSDERRRATTRRRPRRGGPEFADAQFPSDAMADLDEDWAWSHPSEDSIELPDTGLLADSLAHEQTPAAAAAAAPGQTSADAAMVAPPEAPAAPVPAPRPAPPPQAPVEADAGPSTIPSRLPGDGDYQPEQSLPPPSKRKGRPGTRGRGPQTEAPGFIKQAERQAIWRHPAVRAMLSIIALGLVLLLAAQVAQQEHDRLASRYPVLAPYLAQWCQLTGCRLNPPMQIEDLQVDNIALVKTSSLGEDTYRLTAIIHNRAEAALAWPHLDLSLTDANGTVVVRRAFDVSTAARVPADAASGADTQVPPAVPASSSTTLQWQLRAPDLALAGYTVELFYP